MTSEIVIPESDSFRLDKIDLTKFCQVDFVKSKKWQFWDYAVYPSINFLISTSFFSTCKACSALPILSGL